MDHLDALARHQASQEASTDTLFQGGPRRPKASKSPEDVPVDLRGKKFTPQNIKEAFRIPLHQAKAVHFLAESMGLDMNKLRVAVGDDADLEVYNREKSKTGFDQDYLRRRLSETSLVSLPDAAQMLGPKAPEYLDAVIEFMKGQREKAIAGEFLPSDVAKAYLLTLGSMHAGENNLAQIEKKTGLKFPPEYVTYNKNGEKMIRPEEAVAYWFTTEEGKTALRAVNSGDYRTDYGVDLFKGLNKLRDIFGNNDIRTNAFSIKRGVYSEAKDPGITMKGIRALAERINAARGDVGQISSALSELTGIGPAKVGFIKYLLGFGNTATADAVEINYWLTGQGDVSRLDTRQAELARDLKNKGSGNPETQTRLQQIVQDRLEGLYDLLGLGEGPNPIPKEYAIHFLHHWLWDKAKQAETTHEGMQKSMAEGLDPAFAQSITQDKARVIKGLIRFVNAEKAIMKGFSQADLGTAIHEMSHAARRLLFDRSLPPELRLGITDEDIKAVEDWCGVAEDGIWHRDAEEAFAKANEQYFKNGFKIKENGKVVANRPLSEAFIEVFHKIANWLKDIYVKITSGGNKERYNPAPKGVSAPVRQAFDNLYTRNDRLREQGYTEEQIQNMRFADSRSQDPEGTPPRLYEEGDAPVPKDIKGELWTSNRQIPMETPLFRTEDGIEVGLKRGAGRGTRAKIVARYPGDKSWSAAGLYGDYPSPEDALREMGDRNFLGRYLENWKGNVGGSTTPPVRGKFVHPSMLMRNASGRRVEWSRLDPQEQRQAMADAYRMVRERWPGRSTVNLPDVKEYLGFSNNSEWQNLVGEMAANGVAEFMQAVHPHQMSFKADVSALDHWVATGGFKKPVSKSPPQMVSEVSMPWGRGDAKLTLRVGPTPDFEGAYSLYNAAGEMVVRNAGQSPEEAENNFRKGLYDRTIEAAIQEGKITQADLPLTGRAAVREGLVSRDSGKSEETPQGSRTGRAAAREASGTSESSLAETPATQEPVKIRLTVYGGKLGNYDKGRNKVFDSLESFREYMDQPGNSVSAGVIDRFGIAHVWHQGPRGGERHFYFDGVSPRDVFPDLDPTDYEYDPFTEGTDFRPDFKHPVGEALPVNYRELALNIGRPGEFIDSDWMYLSIPKMLKQMTPDQRREFVDYLKEFTPNRAKAFDDILEEVGEKESRNVPAPTDTEVDNAALESIVTGDDTPPASLNTPQETAETATTPKKTYRIGLYATAPGGRAKAIVLDRPLSNAREVTEFPIRELEPNERITMVFEAENDMAARKFMEENFLPDDSRPMNLSSEMSKTFRLTPKAPTVDAAHEPFQLSKNGTLPVKAARQWVGLRDQLNEVSEELQQAIDEHNAASPEERKALEPRVRELAAVADGIIQTMESFRSDVESMSDGMQDDMSEAAAERYEDWRGSWEDPIEHEGLEQDPKTGEFSHDVADVVAAIEGYPHKPENSQGYSEEWPEEGQPNPYKHKPAATEPEAKQTETPQETVAEEASPKPGPRVTEVFGGKRDHIPTTVKSWTIDQQAKALGFEVQRGALPFHDTKLDFEIRKYGKNEYGLTVHQPPNAEGLRESINLGKFWTMAMAKEGANGFMTYYRPTPYVVQADTPSGDSDMEVYYDFKNAQEAARDMSLRMLDAGVEPRDTAVTVFRGNDWDRSNGGYRDASGNNVGPDIQISPDAEAVHTYSALFDYANENNRIIRGAPNPQFREGQPTLAARVAAAQARKTPTDQTPQETEETPTEDPEVKAMESIATNETPTPTDAEATARGLADLAGETNTETTAPDYESMIKIAADSVEKLRKPDVHRVLSSAPAEMRKDLAEYIRQNRPDLKSEIEESLLDIDVYGERSVEDSKVPLDEPLFARDRHEYRVVEKEGIPRYELQRRPAVRYDPKLKRKIAVPNEPWEFVSQDNDSEALVREFFKDHRFAHVYDPVVQEIADSVRESHPDLYRNPQAPDAEPFEGIPTDGTVLLHDAKEGHEFALSRAKDGTYRLMTRDVSETIPGEWEPYVYDAQNPAPEFSDPEGALRYLLFDPEGPEHLDTARSEIKADVYTHPALTEWLDQNQARITQDEAFKSKWGKRSAPALRNALAERLEALSDQDLADLYQATREFLPSRRDPGAGPDMERVLAKYGISLLDLQEQAGNNEKYNVSPHNASDLVPDLIRDAYRQRTQSDTPGQTSLLDSPSLPEDERHFTNRALDSLAANDPTPATDTPETETALNEMADGVNNLGNGAPEGAEDITHEGFRIYRTRAGGRDRFAVQSIENMENGTKKSGDQLFDNLEDAKAQAEHQRAEISRRPAAAPTKPDPSTPTPEPTPLESAVQSFVAGRLPRDRARIGPYLNKPISIDGATRPLAEYLWDRVSKGWTVETRPGGSRRLAGPDGAFNDNLPKTALDFAEHLIAQGSTGTETASVPETPAPVETPTRSEPPAPREIAVGAAVGLSDEEIIARIKRDNPGIDPRNAYNEYVKATGLQPNLDMKPFQQLFASVDPSLGAEKSRVMWTPTHYDTATDQWVMVEPPTGGKGPYRVTFMDGATGTDPADEYFQSRYEPIPESPASVKTETPQVPGETSTSTPEEAPASPAAAPDADVQTFLTHGTSVQVPLETTPSATSQVPVGEPLIREALEDGNLFEYRIVENAIPRGDHWSDRFSVVFRKAGSDGTELFPDQWLSGGDTPEEAFQKFWETHGPALEKAAAESPSGVQAHDSVKSYLPQTPAPGGASQVPEETSTDTPTGGAEGDNPMTGTDTSDNTMEGLFAEPDVPAEWPDDISPDMQEFLENSLQATPEDLLDEGARAFFTEQYKGVRNFAKAVGRPDLSGSDAFDLVLRIYSEGRAKYKAAINAANAVAPDPALEASYNEFEAEMDSLLKGRPPSKTLQALNRGLIHDNVERIVGPAPEAPPVQEPSTPPAPTDAQVDDAALGTLADPNAPASPPVADPTLGSGTPDSAYFDTPASPPGEDAASPSGVRPNEPLFSWTDSSGRSREYQILQEPDGGFRVFEYINTPNGRGGTERTFRGSQQTGATPEEAIRAHLSSQPELLQAMKESGVQTHNDAVASVLRDVDRAAVPSSQDPTTSSQAPAAAALEDMAATPPPPSRPANPFEKAPGISMVPARNGNAGRLPPLSPAAAAVLDAQSSPQAAASAAGQPPPNVPNRVRAKYADPLGGAMKPGGGAEPPGTTAPEAVGDREPPQFGPWWIPGMMVASSMIPEYEKGYSVKQRPYDGLGQNPYQRVAQHGLWTAGLLKVGHMADQAAAPLIPRLIAQNAGAADALGPLTRMQRAGVFGNTFLQKGLNAAGTLSAASEAAHNQWGGGRQISENDARQGLVGGLIPMNAGVANALEKGSAIGNTILTGTELAGLAGMGAEALGYSAPGLLGLSSAAAPVALAAGIGYAGSKGIVEPLARRYAAGQWGDVHADTGAMPGNPAAAREWAQQRMRQAGEILRTNSRKDAQGRIQFDPESQRQYQKFINETGSMLRNKQGLGMSAGSAQNILSNAYQGAIHEDFDKYNAEHGLTRDFNTEKADVSSLYNIDPHRQGAAWRRPTVGVDNWGDRNSSTNQIMSDRSLGRVGNEPIYTEPDSEGLLHRYLGWTGIF